MARALAEAGLRAISALVPPDLAAASDYGLNVWVLTFTLALSILSGIACGLILGLQASRFDLYNEPKEGARTTGAAGRQAIRRILVVAEIASAIILLAGAGLLIRSFQRLMDVDPGFRTHYNPRVRGEQTPAFSSEQSKLTNEQRIAHLRWQSLDYEAFLARIRALLGMEAAGGISVLPLGTAMRSASRFLEGQPAPFGRRRPGPASAITQLWIVSKRGASAKTVSIL